MSTPLFRSLQFTGWTPVCHCRRPGPVVVAGVNKENSGREGWSGCPVSARNFGGSLKKRGEGLREGWLTLSHRKGLHRSSKSVGPLDYMKDLDFAVH